MQHSFRVVGIFNLTHSLKLIRDDGRVFYWKLHATHKISRYTIGMVVTPYIPGGVK